MGGKRTSRCAAAFRVGRHSLSAGALTLPPAIKLYMERTLQIFQFVPSSPTHPAAPGARKSYALSRDRVDIAAIPVIALMRSVTSVTVWTKAKRDGSGLELSKEYINLPSTSCSSQTQAVQR